METSHSLVAKLKEIEPQEFENLTYDLLFLSGMRNLRWRTPGADGGRDLEGQFTVTDFASEQVVQKWYIECKRYSASLDWPTVYGKLAIAENHNADFLLFVTTSNFSNPCRDEVDVHNRRNRVKIRIWPFYELDNLLSIHGQLAVKYGVRSNKADLPVDFLIIVRELAKLASSTYAASEFGQNISGRVELIAAITELFHTRAIEARNFGRFVRTPFKTLRDSYEWCHPYPLPENKFDQTSLRAALVCLYAVSGEAELHCDVDSDRVRVRKTEKLSSLDSNELFSLIQTFGLINVESTTTEIILVARD